MPERRRESHRPKRISSHTSATEAVETCEKRDRGIRSMADLPALKKAFKYQFMVAFIAVDVRHSRC